MVHKFSRLGMGRIEKYKGKVERRSKGVVIGAQESRGNAPMFGGRSIGYPDRSRPFCRNVLKSILRHSVRALVGMLMKGG